MSISVGSSLGAYEITGLLGEGGMGRVFKARDTRLKRDVAIKALPDEFALDAERTARFRREAEALAALNHPHIGGIHDIFELGGSQFLVLELVDGETLAERIRRGPIPLPEAIAIARQVAEALEAAHERGIVHRDLKPANVKVTADGRVKVLDFGLAKDLDRSTGAASLTHSPTFVGGATKAGVILGTAAYMSPEQARGLPVGAQADVWALGCVLYELLTGRQPFSGPTVTDVLAAVVRGEPDWAALPSDTPAALRWLLRRCLQKELSRRLHHMADVRIDLEDVPADTPVAAAASARRPSSRSALTAIAGIGLIAVSLASAYVISSRRGTVAPELHVDIATPASSEPLSIALSPDGLKLVYAATVDGMTRLVVRTLVDGKTQTMPGTELAAQPFWSPDSRSIGFFADGRLKRIDLAGGLTQTIAAAPIGGGGDWSRDGVVLYAPTILGGLFRVSAGGGEPVAVTRPITNRQNGHRVPRFLSDGKHFVFFSSGVLEARGVYLGSLDGSPPMRLMDIDVAAIVGPSDELLFVRQGTLFAQQLRVERGELAGDPVAVANRVAFDTNVTQAAITASKAGSLAYRTGVATGQRLLVWLDRSGRKVGQIGNADTAAMFNPELSADGRFVAVNRTVDNTDVWLIEAARGVLRRFSFDADTDQIAVWSPDGKRVVFSSNRKGAYNLYQKPADSPGAEELLLETDENKFAMGFSADGRYLLYRNTAPNTNWDLWVLPLFGEVRKPFPVVKTAFQEMIGEFSPDSRWIAYQTNESGQFEVYVQSFPEPGSRTQISTFGGSQPRWRRDGTELYYIALDGQLMAAPVSVNANRFLETGAPVPLFMTRTPGGAIPSPQKQQYAVSSDGQRFLFNTLADEGWTTSPISLVLNWRLPVAK